MVPQMLSTRFRRCVAGVLACGAVAASSGTVNPQAALQTAIARYDSTLKGLASAEKLTSTGAQSQFAELLKTRPSLNTLLLISSKGKVLVEVDRAGKPGRKGRSVASQGWFSETHSGGTPYRGFLQSRDGTMELFWAYPTRGNAVVAAKIDLQGLLRAVAANASAAFALLQNGATLFEHEKLQDSAAQTLPANIPGLEGVSLRMAKVVAEPPPAAAPETAAVQQPSTVQRLVSLPEDPKVQHSLRVAIGALAVGALILLVLLISVILHNRRKHREALVHDFEDFAPPVPLRRPTAPMPVSGMRPPTRVYQKAVSRASKPTEEMKSPVVEPPPEGPVPRQRPQHAPESDAKTVVADSPIMSIESIEEMRKRITEEVTTKVQQDIQRQVEQEHKRFTAHAEVFQRTVKTHMGQLVEQLSEAETRWSELSSAIKSSAYKLQQALDGFEQHKPDGSP